MASNAIEHALLKSAQIDVTCVDVICFLVDFDTQRFARMDFLEITVSDSTVARCDLLDPPISDIFTLGIHVSPFLKINLKPVITFFIEITPDIFTFWIYNYFIIFFYKVGTNTFLMTEKVSRAAKGSPWIHSRWRRPSCASLITISWPCERAAHSKKYLFPLCSVTLTVTVISALTGELFMMQITVYPYCGIPFCEVLLHDPHTSIFDHGQ